MKNSLISIFREANWLTPDRLWRIAIVVSVIWPISIAIVFWPHSSPQGLMIAGNAPLGGDFVNFWSGAQLAFRGHVATVYDLPKFLAYEKGHVWFAQFRWYAYPPITLLLSAPLAILPYIPAYLLWLATGTGLCVWLFSRLMSWPAALLTATMTPAVFINAVSGQNGQFTAALLAGALMLLDSSPALSGLLFGLLCYKPHLGILVPFALAADGRWRALACASLTVAALLATTVAVFGWASWVEYLRVAPLNRLILEQGSLPPVIANINFWHRLPSIFAALRLVGAGVRESYAAQILSAAVAMVITVKVWRGSAASSVKSAVLVIGTALATPYIWDYDLVVLTFAIVWLWQEASRTGFRLWEKSVYAGTLVMTLFYVQIAKATHISIAQVFLWIVFLFAANRAPEFAVWKALSFGQRREHPGEVT